MMEEEGTIDFDGLTPKELTKLYKVKIHLIYKIVNSSFHSHLL